MPLNIQLNNYGDESKEDFAIAQDFDDRRENLKVNCIEVSDLIEYLPAARVQELYDELIIEIIEEGYDK